MMTFLKTGCTCSYCLRHPLCVGIGQYFGSLPGYSCLNSTPTSLIDLH